MTRRPLLCAGPPRLDGSSHSFGARIRVRDRPLLPWAHDPRMSGPYFALGRAVATFAPGAGSVFGPYFALGRDLAAFALGPGPSVLPLVLCAGPRPCPALLRRPGVSYLGPFWRPSPFCVGRAISLSVLLFWADRPSFDPFAFA